MKTFYVQCPGGGDRGICTMYFIWIDLCTYNHNSQNKNVGFLIGMVFQQTSFFFSLFNLLVGLHISQNLKAEDSHEINLRQLINSVTGRLYFNWLKTASSSLFADGDMFLGLARVHWSSMSRSWKWTDFISSMRSVCSLRSSYIFWNIEPWQYI